MAGPQKDFPFSPFIDDPVHYISYVKMDTDSKSLILLY